MAQPVGTIRSQYSGFARVFVTATTYRRRPVFRDALVARHAISELLRAAKKARVEVSAYCVMPEHVHVLLAGVDEDSHIMLAVHRWKQATGFSYRKQFGERLWQRAYWGRALRQRDHARDVLEYMLSDPLRSGVVERLEDYPFIGSDRWSNAELIAFGEAGFVRRGSTIGSVSKWPG